MPTTRSGDRGTVAALAVLACVAALGIVAIHMFAVGTATGQRWDADAARIGAGGGATAAWEATERLLETISVASLAMLGVGIMLIALVRRRPWLAVGAGVIVVGANVSTQVVKAAIDRPDLIAGGPPDPGAFPSGHATVAMSLAMALVLVSPPLVRWTAALAGCAYAGGVGIAVIALGWHRPSEVLGAYLMAVAWAALVAAVLAAAPGARGLTADARRDGRARARAALAAALGLAFVALVAVTAAQRVDVLRIADDRTALTAAALACTAVCAALGVALTALLQRIGASRRPGRAG